MTKKREPGDYAVGYGRPPEHARFEAGRRRQPGRAASPKRASSRSTSPPFLSQPIEVKRRGRAKTMSPFELGLRQMVKRAVKDNSLAAALEFFAACEKYGVRDPCPGRAGDRLRALIDYSAAPRRRAARRPTCCHTRTCNDSRTLHRSRISGRIYLDRFGANADTCLSTVDAGHSSGAPGRTRRRSRPVELAASQC